MTGQQNIQTKRHLFMELSEGFDALKRERLGQVILRTYSRKLPQTETAPTVHANPNGSADYSLFS